MRLFLVVFLFLLASCAQEPKKTKRVESASANLCRYSQFLRIYKTPHGHRIEILNPDKKQALFEFEVENGATHLAVMSATHIGMLSALHEEKRVVAISDIRYVFSPVIRERFRQNRVFELQNESALSIDVLCRSKANYVIYSAFSGSFSQENQLKKLGITCIPDYDWREQSALGRAEWILLFGVLCDRLPEAMRLFKTIERAYQKPAQITYNVLKPEVISGNVTGDFWYAPAGESFMAEIFKKAGLSYVYASTKGTGSLAYSMEKIVQDGQNVKIWLNPGFSSKNDILMVNPKAKYLPFFQRGKVFCYTHDANKFWELSTLRPDWLVEDLTQIASGKTTKNLHFYKELR